MASARVALATAKVSPRRGGRRAAVESSSTGRVGGTPGDRGDCVLSLAPVLLGHWVIHGKWCAIIWTIGGGNSSAGGHPIGIGRGHNLTIAPPMDSNGGRGGYAFGE